MIWQTDRTSWPYRWNFVCFDSVLSARMMKGCAPDHAQVWAAQRKRACENQVKKVTCLLGNGGRKIIWKPVTQKKARDFAKVRVLLMWIRTRWLRRVRRWPIIRNRKINWKSWLRSRYVDVSLTLVSFGIELSMKRRRPMGSLTIGILDYDSRHEAGQKGRWTLGRLPTWRGHAWNLLLAR